MRNILTAFGEFLWAHIFILSTGFAALLHSTWTLATAFNRIEPAFLSWAWIAWVIPGFALAFSFDAGQIAISVLMRNGMRSRELKAAFAILAIATYYTQWWYIAHHFPNLGLSGGLREDWRPFASLLSDAIVWIAPGMLPLATVLYTFGYGRLKRSPANMRTQPAKSANAETSAVRIEHAETVQIAQTQSKQLEAGQSYAIQCPDCDWRKIAVSQKSAINSLTAHRRHRHNG